MRLPSCFLTICPVWSAIVRFDHLDGEPIFVVAALGKQMIPVMVIYIQYIYCYGSVPIKCHLRPDEHSFTGYFDPHQQGFDFDVSPDSVEKFKSAAKTRGCDWWRVLLSIERLGIKQFQFVQSCDAQQNNWLGHPRKYLNCPENNVKIIGVLQNNTCTRVHHGKIARKLPKDPPLIQSRQCSSNTVGYIFHDYPITS